MSEDMIDKGCNENRKLPIDCLIVALRLDDFWRLNSVGQCWFYSTYYIYVDYEADETVWYDVIDKAIEFFDDTHKIFWRAAKGPSPVCYDLHAPKINSKN